jgi:SSS family solute:Na+ symporter
MTGLNPFLILLVVGGLLVVVNLYGGMQAVVWLDVFQGFMLFASGFICLFALILSIDGGLTEAMKTATSFGRTGFGPYDFRFDQLTLWVMIINGAFYAIQKYGTDQTVVQRYLSADSDRSAIRASMLGISLTVPIWAIFMFIGTLLFVFYQSHPLPKGAVAASVFPHFIMTQLPVGVAGFIVAALISAAICSLSADLNSLAAVGLEDYYRTWKKDRPDREYLMAGKMFVGISGLLAVGVGALYLLAGNEGVLGIIFTVYAIFSGGIVGIFLLGVFVPRANRRGVNIGIIACIIFTAWAFLTSTPLGIDHPCLLLDMGEYNFGHHKLMLGVYSHLVVIVVGYVASLFFPKEVVDDRLLFRRGR